MDARELNAREVALIWRVEVGYIGDRIVDYRSIEEECGGYCRKVIRVSDK